MTHRQRILADRLVAVPMAFLFNGVARVLGRAMRRNHSSEASKIRNIVVAKLIGMGSILQATPLLKALKQHFPGARITFVTLRSNRELLGRLSCIDNVLVLDDRSVIAMALTTLQTIASLIRLRADLYFDLELYSAFSSLLALFAVTRNRIGFYRHSVAFKNGIYTHLVYFNTRIPIRRLYLQLGRVVGVPPGHTERTGPVLVDEESRAGVKRFLSTATNWPSMEPYIVVNANASDLLLERRWPAEYFVATLEHLARLGNRIVMIGISSESPYVQELCDGISPEVKCQVLNSAGRLRLGELLALMEGAACVLTNDTGPMHMAIALDRPTVCLFGPANPEHYGQDLDFVEIFYYPVFCSPCLYEADEPPCHGKNICMQMIQPEPVVESVLRLSKYGTPDYEPQKIGRRLSDKKIPADAADGAPLGLVVRASLHGAN